MDTRIPPDAAGSPRVASQNRIDNATLAGVGGALQLTRRTGVAGVDILIDLEGAGPERPIVLSPGHRVDVVNITANTILQAAMFGYQRPARPEELVFT